MIATPNSIQKLVAGLPFEPNHLGESIALNYRIGERYFLKVQVLGSAEPLSQDVAVLNFLTQYIPVPNVVRFDQDDSNEFLLTSCIHGEPACNLGRSRSKEIAIAYGLALRHFHDSVPVSECPFPQTLATKVEACRDRARRGLVETDNFDDERSGWSVEKLLNELEKNLPGTEDLVVTHGDYCMPNVMFDSGLNLTGYIDLGRSGIADRHTDIAQGSRSISRNLGPEYLDDFIEAYGLKVDPKNIQFYQLLDEFF